MEIALVGERTNGVESVAARRDCTSSAKRFSNAGSWTDCVAASSIDPHYRVTIGHCYNRWSKREAADCYRARRGGSRCNSQRQNPNTKQFGKHSSHKGSSILRDDSRMKNASSAWKAKIRVGPRLRQTQRHHSENH